MSWDWWLGLYVIAGLIGVCLWLLSSGGYVRGDWAAIILIMLAWPLALATFVFVGLVTFAEYIGHYQGWRWFTRRRRRH